MADFLKLPFRAVGFLVSLAFVGAIVELIGMTMYLQWRSEEALNGLVAGGVTPMEAVRFVLASPDRLAVAGGLAVLAVLLVLSDSSGSGGHVDGGGFDGDGGFGGDGGGGGDGGSGGGGGDGGE